MLTIKTCSFRRWESCIWCWCTRLLLRASTKFKESIEWGQPNFHSFSGNSRSYLRCSLNKIKNTSLVFEHVEDWQNLPVVGHQGLTNHLSGKHEFLYFLESQAHNIVILGRKGLCVDKVILLMGMMSWGRTGSSLLGHFSMSSSVPWLAKNLYGYSVSLSPSKKMGKCRW